MTQKLHSLGHLVARLQRSPGSIEVAIARLNIEPAIELNSVAYYSVEDEVRIDQAIRQAQAEAILGRPIPQSA